MTHETIAVDMKDLRHPLLPKLYPFILTFLILAADQITKHLVIANIPEHTAKYSFFNGLVRIIHVRNIGVAFSVGDAFPDTVRKIFFLIIPAFVIIGVIIAYFKTDELTFLQRWALCGIIGGGCGNLFDRFYRPTGVVDFIDIKFYGLFGLDRFPTFNIADSAVVVCCILFIITLLISVFKEDSQKKEVK